MLKRGTEKVNKFRNNVYIAYSIEEITERMKQ